MQVHLTIKSANIKTGPIPVSTTTKSRNCLKANCGATTKRATYRKTLS